MNCDELTGRLRDICRGHDDAGHPIEMSVKKRQRYLDKWAGVIRPEKPMPKPVECDHRGEELRKQKGELCGCKSPQSVFACSVHGECTLNKVTKRIMSCALCDDRSSAEDRHSAAGG